MAGARSAGAGGVGGTSFLAQEAHVQSGEKTQIQGKLHVSQSRPQEEMRALVRCMTRPACSEQKARVTRDS